MTIKHNAPKLIYVMGIDGSGKSTVSEHLAENLREKGYDVDVIWLRYNHVITKPLLGLCRLIGLTRYEMCDGIRVGYHDFYKSSFISNLFIALQYLDAVRVKYTKILPRYGKPNKVLILDRYIYDILVDVAVDTRREHLLTSWIGKRFIKLLPEDTVTILVKRNLDDVLGVRPEGIVDDNFKSRFEHYEELQEEKSINTINNSGELSDLLDTAMDIAGLNNES